MIQLVRCWTQRKELNSAKITAFLHAWLRVILSLAKPLGKVHTSGPGSLSLSPFGPVVLSNSHSAEDEDKTEMAPLKEPERAERTSKRTAFSAIHPPSLGMYRGRQNIVCSLWVELTQPRAHLRPSL